MSDLTASSVLLLIDFQERLMPAICDGASVLANAGRLAAAARLLGIPIVATEQNPDGLGRTVAPLVRAIDRLVEKRSFDATRAPTWQASLPTGRDTLIVAGCEAHVCVLQTVLSLVRAHDTDIRVVADACGSRAPINHAAALERMGRAGANIATTEMMIFEWLGSCDHPHFREVLGLIK